MPIEVSINGQYADPTGPNKYRPLLNPGYELADQPVYSGFLNQRATLLEKSGAWPVPLRLAAPSWNTLIQAETAAGRLAPIVVISSNRSDWIARGLEASVAQMAVVNGAVFDGPGDVRALGGNMLPLINQSPPIYAPNRIGPYRGIYICVHIAEYTKYKLALAAFPEVTVIGWSFKQNTHRRRHSNRSTISGFGASRYAAIEFCKTLYAAAVMPWTLAWMFDDNVVAMNNFRPLTDFEQKLLSDSPNHAVMGFRGDTQPVLVGTNRTWSRQLNPAINPAPPPPVPPPAFPNNVTPALVQQAALWNIKYLAQERINFGKTFVNSAEDVSLCAFFNRAPITYMHYSGIAIRKETVLGHAHDNDDSAAVVAAQRAALTQFFSDAELLSTVAPPALRTPPLVTDRDHPDLGTPVLGAFVTDSVIPGTQYIDAQNRNVPRRNQARAEAVEQLTSTALGMKQGNNLFVSIAARDATFRLPAADTPAARQSQTIRVDAP